MRWPLSPNLSLYEPKSTISLLRSSQPIRSAFAATILLNFQTTRLSKLLHLDVVSISAVAFQCNNNPGAPLDANLWPQRGTKAHPTNMTACHFLCLRGLIIVIIASGHRRGVLLWF